MKFKFQSYYSLISNANMMFAEVAVTTFQSYYSLISNKVGQLAQSFQGNFNPIIVLFLTEVSDEFLTFSSDISILL